MSETDQRDDEVNDRLSESTPLISHVTGRPTRGGPLTHQEGAREPRVKGLVEAQTKRQRRPR